MKINKISTNILQNSFIIILLIFLLSAIAGIFLPKIQVDNSIDIFFNKEGDSYLNFQEWKKQFGSDNVIIVAFKDADIFTYNNLMLIESLSNEFEALKYVSDVTSLTTVNNIMGIEEDFIVEKLFEEIPENPSEIKTIKNIALNNPLYIKNIISEDGTVSAILIELEHIEGKEDQYKKETIEQIHSILEKSHSGKKFYISGLTAIEYDFASYMKDDLKTFMPFMMLIISLILYISFRSLKMIFLPLLSIGISLSFSMLILYLFGYTINNVTTIIPPVLMAIMIADSIHLLAESIENKPQGQKDNNFNFLAKTMNHLFFPCFLTTATTAVGFISLATSKITPVRQLGIVVGIGVFFALIITFTFLPAMTKQFNLLPKKRKKQEESKSSLMCSKFLTSLGTFNIRNQKKILVCTGFLVVLCIWGITKIKVETSVIEFFKKDSPIYTATTFVENNLSGVHPINISLKSEEAEHFKSPEALNAIEALTAFLFTIEEVDKVSSINDYIKDINQSLHNEEKTFYRIPETKNEISQYLLLYGRDDLDDFVDNQWKWTTVRVRLKEHSTIKLKKVIEEIDQYLRTHVKEFDSAETLGQTVLEVETNNAVTDGQLKSLLLAMGIIFCMMFIVFKSIPVGIVSIIPNVLPILINFGIMGFFNIRLNSATSMISAIGIGIVVDDTIHFLHSYQEGIIKTGNYTDALQYTLKNKGRPITFTSIILFFGFGILSFSKFLPTASFGFLSAMLMLNALLADLIILPAVLLWIKPDFRNKIKDKRRQRIKPWYLLKNFNK